jgi:homogentisate phytyltransferase/homogentisate geranylgeranyltransferase
MKQLRALYEFGRPHTLAGTTFQALGMFTIVIAGERLAPAALVALLLAWAGSLAANLYVVGLNQLYDLEIDRVNKPYLPLASGDLSPRGGQGIVLSAGLVALLIGSWAGRYLLGTLALVMFIGTLYSVSPIRLKLRAGWAAVSIALARGVIANAGLYLYFERALAPPYPLSRAALAWGLGFFFLFGVVIALYKDIPDWAGDQKYRVYTFAVVLGRERVFRLGRWLLTGIYLLTASLGLLLLPGPGGLALALFHAGACALFWMRGRTTDPGQPGAMARLYRLLWVLFYAEYVFLGLYRLLLAAG